MFDDIIFDLYGTLVDIHTDEEKAELWEGMARWYRKLGADYAPEELKKRYFSLVSALESDAGDAHEGHPEVDIGQVFGELLGTVGTSLDTLRMTAGRFRELSTEYIRLYPHATELLSTLKAEGRRVWLLTNAQSLFTRPEIERLGIEKYFDGIYISSEYGVKKPDIRFFQYLLTERNIDPERAVMVGNDGRADIEGARAAGLHTVYIRSNISPIEPTPEAELVVGEMDLERVRDFLIRRC